MDEFHQMVLPAPPDGTNWVDTITTDVTMVLMITMFSSFCVPMLCALYFFSARKGCQKSLVFHLNAAVLCLGIFQGAYCVGVVTRNLIHPTNQLPQGWIVFYYALSFFTPILVESVLIFRLVAIYADHKYRKHRPYIVGFPIALKVIRFANACLLLTFWVRANRERNLPIATGIYGYSRFPFPKIGWGLQVLDNGFCALAFLKRLRQRILEPAGVFRQGALLSRLRGIFVLALSNFILPCILGLTHLVIAILDHQWSRTRWFHNCNYIMIVNNYTSIVGVVFATIWASSIEWQSPKGLCGCSNHATHWSGDTGPLSSGSGSHTFSGERSPYSPSGLGVFPQSSTSTRFSVGSPGHMTPKRGAEAHFLPESYVKYYPSDAEEKSPDTPSVPLRIHVERIRQVRYEVEMDGEVDSEKEVGHGLDAKRRLVGIAE